MSQAEWPANTEAPRQERDWDIQGTKSKLHVARVWRQHEKGHRMLARGLRPVMVGLSSGFCSRSSQEPWKGFRQRHYMIEPVVSSITMGRTDRTEARMEAPKNEIH